MASAAGAPAVLDGFRLALESVEFWQGRAIGCTIASGFGALTADARTPCSLRARVSRDVGAVDRYRLALAVHALVRRRRAIVREKLLPDTGQLGSVGHFATTQPAWGTRR